MKRLIVCLCLSLATLALGRGREDPRFHGRYTGTTTYTTHFQGEERRTGTRPVALRIVEGTDSDIVLVDSLGGCALPANVDQDVARLRGGARCTSVHEGLTITSVLVAGKGIVTGSGLEVDLLATFTLTAHGQSSSGTEVQHYSLTRVGP